MKGVAKIEQQMGDGGFGDGLWGRCQLGLNVGALEWKEHDLHAFWLQANIAYGRINSILELFLNEAIDGQLLRSRGREFQVFGAICFIDRVSEWLTNMLFFVPLVAYEWFAFSKNGEIPPGNVSWNKW